MLNVGDAVMSFLGDTTNLDQAFSRIVDGADKAMSAASDSVGDFTEVLNNSRSDVDAWNETLVSAMHDAGDAGKEAGEEVASGMEKARSTTYEARGEAALLGEAFGIHLPRHVRSFVAELPGIGTALSAAFAATAVLLRAAGFLDTVFTASFLPALDSSFLAIPSALHCSSRMRV